MSKICLIRQPAGIGDIMFCQKIGLEAAKKGYRVIWPVIDEFRWIGKYLQSDIEYYPMSENFDYKNRYGGDKVINEENFLYIPLERAAENLKNSKKSSMHAKYALVSGDSTDWANHLKLTRDTERENNLYYNILGLKDGEEYVFINNTFASPPNAQTLSTIPIPSDKKVVKMQFIKDDNLFDWCKVLENANEIHTIQTSINYMSEVLNLKAAKKVIYQRPGWGPGFEYIKGLFLTHKWDTIE